MHSHAPEQSIYMHTCSTGVHVRILNPVIRTRAWLLENGLNFIKKTVGKKFNPEIALANFQISELRVIIISLINKVDMVCLSPVEYGV